MCSAAFLERGMPEKSGTLYPILLSAAAQLIFLKTPPHAAIDLAVTLAQYDPQRQRYDKLVNAVLRRVAKRRRGDRGWPRCGAGQHARLALVALGAPIGARRARSDRRRPPRRAAARPHRQERPGGLGGAALGPRAADRKRRLVAQGTHRGAARLSTTAPGGCRTPPHRCPRDCSAMWRARVSPTFARRPAARRRSLPLPAPPSSRSIVEDAARAARREPRAARS